MSKTTSVRRRRIPGFSIAVLTAALAAAMPAQAQQRCHREGTDVICDDGHRGIWSGDTIIRAEKIEKYYAQPSANRIR